MNNLNQEYKNYSHCFCSCCCFKKKRSNHILSSIHKKPFYLLNGIYTRLLHRNQKIKLDIAVFSAHCSQNTRNSAFNRLVKKMHAKWRHELQIMLVKKLHKSTFFLNHRNRNQKHKRIIPKELDNKSNNSNFDNCKHLQKTHRSTFSLSGHISNPTRTQISHFQMTKMQWKKQN